MDAILHWTAVMLFLYVFSSFFHRNVGNEPLLEFETYHFDK
jgi:hypothetical protein